MADIATLGSPDADGPAIHPLCTLLANLFQSQIASVKASATFSIITDVFLRLIKMIIAPWSFRPW